MVSTRFPLTPPLYAKTTALQSLTVPEDEAQLSDYIPSNIVSRQVCSFYLFLWRSGSLFG